MAQHALLGRDRVEQLDVGQRVPAWAAAGRQQRLALGRGEAVTDVLAQSQRHQQVAQQLLMLQRRVGVRGPPSRRR